LRVVLWRPLGTIPAAFFQKRTT